MLRVAHFVTHPIQYFAPLYREINQQGKIDLTVLFGSDFGSKPSYDPGLGRTVQFDVPLLDGYRHEFLHNRGDGKPGPGPRSFDCPDLGSVLNRRRYDALWIHGWGYLAQRQAARAARKAGIPYLLRGESTLIEAPRNSLRWWRRKVLSWSLLRNAAGCLYVGQNNKAFFRSLGVPEKKLWPAHYSIDALQFQRQANQTDRVQTRSQLGAKPDNRVVITVAKLIARKRVEDLVHAVSQMDDTTLLWVIGDGELRQSLVSLGKKLLPRRVCWLGFQNQSQIPRLLHAADLFALASCEETWGLVVNEAMACGLPAVVSDRVGCGADLVRPGTTGFQYRCGDIDDLVSRLCEGLANCAALGPQAFQRIATHYSVQASATQISHAMHSVLPCSAVPRISTKDAKQ